MLARELRPGIALKLLERRHAPAFFDFVERGRERFLDWIPFVSATTSLELAERKILGYLDLHKSGEGYFWALWEGDRIVGLVLIKDIDPEAGTAEIGYMIDRDLEGRGLVKESCRLMLDFVFGELGLNKAVLCCDPENQRSVALARRLGFSSEGLVRQGMRINGRLRDTMLWALFARDYEGSGG